MTIAKANITIRVMDIVPASYETSKRRGRVPTHYLRLRWRVNQPPRLIVRQGILFSVRTVNVRNLSLFLRKLWTTVSFGFWNDVFGQI